MINLSKPIIEEEEIANVNLVLKSGFIAQGPKVKLFEEKFSGYIGSKYSVALNSGTAALHAGLYAMGIKADDEVITVPFTFVATANSIIMQNAKPVFVDIEEDTYNIDINKVEEIITDKTKAILPVDLYGHPYNYKMIKKIADKHNLKILEDACQAVGAEYGNTKAGRLGDIGCFSLYATKNMMCGEGGVITTDDANYAELVKRFRHHGQSEQTRYEYLDLGYNYRMTDINAAIALAQLEKIDGFNKKRIENAKFLTKFLSKIKQIEVPKVLDNCKHVFHQYTIKVPMEKRQALIDFLKSNGISTGIFYPKPLHLHPNFGKYGYKQGDFPQSEKLSKEVLSIPVHPSLTTEELELIANKIGDFFETN
jgi:perosamine synthetase